MKSLPEYGWTGRARWTGRALLRVVVGHGYRPWLAGVWAVPILIAFGLMVWHWSGLFHPKHGAIGPLDDRQERVDGVGGWLDLGQADNWTPTGWIRWVDWGRDPARLGADDAIRRWLHTHSSQGKVGPPLGKSSPLRRAETHDECSSTPWSARPCGSLRSSEAEGTTEKAILRAEAKRPKVSRRSGARGTDSMSARSEFDRPAPASTLKSSIKMRCGGAPSAQAC
jgi:hypothetical protein